MGVHDEKRIRATKSDLKSLGIEPKSDVNVEELHELADAIKQSMYEDYKLAYSDEGGKYEVEASATLTPFSHHKSKPEL